MYMMESPPESIKPRIDRQIRVEYTCANAELFEKHTQSIAAICIAHKYDALATQQT